MLSQQQRQLDPCKATYEPQLVQIGLASVAKALERSSYRGNSSSSSPVSNNSSPQRIFCCA